MELSSPQLPFFSTFFSSIATLCPALPPAFGHPSSYSLSDTVSFCQHTLNHSVIDFISHVTDYAAQTSCIRSACFTPSSRPLIRSHLLTTFQLFTLSTHVVTVRSSIFPPFTYLPPIVNLAGCMCLVTNNFLFAPTRCEACYEGKTKTRVAPLCSPKCGRCWAQRTLQSLAKQMRSVLERGIRISELGVFYFVQFPNS